MFRQLPQQIHLFVVGEAVDLGNLFCHHGLLFASFVFFVEPQQLKHIYLRSAC